MKKYPNLIDVVESSLGIPFKAKDLQQAAFIQIHIKRTDEPLQEHDLWNLYWMWYALDCRCFKVCFTRELVHSQSIAGHPVKELVAELMPEDSLAKLSSKCHQRNPIP